MQQTFCSWSASSYPDQELKHSFDFDTNNNNLSEHLTFNRKYTFMFAIHKAIFDMNEIAFLQE